MTKLVTNSSWIKHDSAACTCPRWQSVPWKPIMHFDLTTLDNVKAPTKLDRFAKEKITLSLRCSWARATRLLTSREELNITNNKNELWKSVRLTSFQKPQLQPLSVNLRQVWHLSLILYLLRGYLYLPFMFWALIFIFHSVLWRSIPPVWVLINFATQLFYGISVHQIGTGSWETTRKDIMIKYSPYWIQDVFNPNIHSSWKHSFQLSILTTYTKTRISKIKYYGNCFITSHWDQKKIKNHNLLYTVFCTPIF